MFVDRKDRKDRKDSFYTPAGRGDGAHRLIGADRPNVRATWYKNPHGAC
jgi:hypothetical protein